MKAGLKRLTKVTRTETPEDSSPVEGSDPFINELADESDDIDEDIFDDVVADARKITVWFRGSFHRLDDLYNTIEAGLKDGTFDPEKIQNLRPMKDMDVRWSSSYFMIDRIIMLHPVSLYAFSDLTNESLIISRQWKGSSRSQHTQMTSAQCSSVMQSCAN